MNAKTPANFPSTINSATTPNDRDREPVENTEAETISQLRDELARERKSNVIARQVLQNSDGILLRLDPELITPSRWHFRQLSKSSSTRYKRLKASIAAHGGNAQPIVVRRSHSVQDEQRYELCSGLLRLRACSELGIPVLAIVANRMLDPELFAHAHATNSAHVPKSAIDDAVMNNRALKDGLYPSERRLAEAINRSATDVHRGICLASLPRVILDAFARPAELKVEQIEALLEAIEPPANRDAVTAVARQIIGSGPRHSTVETVRLFVEAGCPATCSVPRRPKVDPDLAEIQRRDREARLYLAAIPRPAQVRKGSKRAALP